MRASEVYRPHGGHLLALSRVKAIRRMAATAGEVKLRELYEELYGALAGSQLTVERMRASLQEACDELLSVDVPVEDDSPDVNDLL